MQDFQHQIRLLVEEIVVKEKQGKKLYDYQKNDLDEIFRNHIHPMYLIKLCGLKKKNKIGPVVQEEIDKQ